MPPKKKTGKFDIYKAYAADYVTPKTPALVELKPAQYLAIIGRGKPGGAEFQARIGALYNVAFTVKMARKFAGRDYTVSKLEGIWWGGGKGDFLNDPQETWNWKLVIRIPEFITPKEVDAAIERLRAKGKPAEVAEVKLETIDEGRSVQVLHLGPYEKEPETVRQMQSFAEQSGLRFHGLHHEIYLSDPRRVPPSKLRTILRYPVK
jgi:hypothetical protein